MNGKQLPSFCPACGERLSITALGCPACETAITGCFEPGACAALEPRLKTFHDVFLKSRGNIKDVERTLGISYPTVRGLLDELLAVLFPDENRTADDNRVTDAGDVLARLEAGEITAAVAARLLKGERDDGSVN